MVAYLYWSFVSVVYLLMYSFLLLFFFFKQKTAYEMRISDWSSDVCSSDLGEGGTREDTAIIEILATAGATNNFPQSGLNFMRYHSLRYFCDGQPAGPQNFLLATPDALTVAPSPLPKADVLLTQGFRDTLFNFNDGQIGRAHV